MGKINAEVANDFITSLGDLYDTCGFIQDAGGCDRCPLKGNCLDETTLNEFANFVTKGNIREFLGFGEDVENYANEQDMANYHAELDAQKERELWADWTR